MDRKGSPVESADLPANRVREERADFTAAGSSVVRAGYRTLAGSLIVTLIGTIMLAQGRSSFEAAASIVRQVGTVSMLISCAVVLLGYRVPQLRGFIAKMQEARDGMDTLNRAEDSTSSQQTQFSVKHLFELAIVFAIVLAIVFGVLFLTPNGVFAFFAAYLHMTLVALLIVVIVYDRGMLRAFCIAAIVPAMLSFLMMSLFDAFLMQSRRGFYDSFGYRLAIAVNWGMIVIIGLLGVGLRYYLAAGKRRNGPSGH